MAPLDRQLRRFRAALSRKRRAQALHDSEEQLYQASTPQDTANVRAKSQGHGKKTADKWNQ